MSEAKLSLADLRKNQSKKDQESTSLKWDKDGGGLAVFNGVNGVPGDAEIRAIITHVGKNPDDYHWEVSDISWNSAGWHRDRADIREKHTAYTEPSMVVKIKIDKIKNSAFIRETEADVAALCKLIEKRKPSNKSIVLNDSTGRSLLWLWSDTQAGKGEGGGSTALANRMGAALENLLAYLTELEKLGKRPDTVYIVGMGDLVEQCEGHYCVAADTPILTDDLRWVPAGSLKVGDELYACSEDGQTARGRRYERSSVLANKVELMDAVKVTFSDGRSLVCTPEHPLLSAGKNQNNKKAHWVAAKDLTIGERIARVFDGTWDPIDSYDVGWLSGLYDGEGYLSAGKDRSGPNILGISQKPGAVLENAKRILGDLGFEYSDKVHESSGVATLKTKGGFPEIMRALGTIRPLRLLPKLGYPYMQASWPSVVSVEDAGAVEMARLGTSSHTYISDGYVSHNSMQAFQVDLDRRQQMKLMRRLLLEAINALVDRGYAVAIAAVPGNHGENRNSDGKAFTSWTDNDDVAIFEQVAEILAANPERYKNVTVPPGGLDSEDLVVTLEVSGVKCAFAHGHQFKQGANPTAKAEGWWKGQALGRQRVSAADILFSGHYHHFACSEGSGRTWFQCPAQDGGSNWFTYTSGQSSPAGMIAVCIGTAYPRGGWGDLRIV